MKIPLFYISLLTVSCTFFTLTYTTPSHAKTIHPATHVGTWENKDEDGDGVPDEQDGYPFDVTKTTMSVVQAKNKQDTYFKK